jgi:hypothetical protein
VRSPFSQATDLLERVEVDEGDAGDDIDLRQLRHHTKNTLQRILGLIAQAPGLCDTPAGEKIAQELEYRIALSANISNALFGLTNMVAVLIVGTFVFGISLGISNPILFTVSLLLTLLSVSALGLIFASAFVLSRSAQTLTNGLETPLYIISGSMFPIALLPFWSHPIAYILGPTWGIDAIRLATSQDYASQTFWVGMGTNMALFLDLTVMILITAAYVAIATVLFKMVETRARTKGTLVEA